MREQIAFGELEIDDVFYYKKIHRKKEVVLEAVKIEREFFRNAMNRLGSDAGTFEFFHDDHIVEIEV